MKKVKVKIWYYYWARHENEVEIEIRDDADPEDYISNNEKDILVKHKAEEDLDSQLDMDYAGVKLIKEAGHD